MPRGPCIGWVSGNDLFLEPVVSYQVARVLGGAESLQLSEQSLRRRLHDHGLLVSTDPGREMLTIRRTLAGCPRQVLHLNAAALLGWTILLSGITQNPTNESGPFDPAATPNSADRR